jgi:tetraacyldisaccharide 4'-kinase
MQELNQEDYKKLISGQKKELCAVVLRIILRIASFFYGFAVEIRNFLYDKNILKTHHSKAVVISIGNITTGGTGKTPLVVWLCNYLTQNYKCAILTRGYKTTQNSKLQTQNYIDEPEILRQSCPQANIIINPDRVAGAAEAVDKLGAKILIMDDGFQHRRLARDLDIVTIDATVPFGYGKLLPAGLLREPAKSLKRADSVVITRSDQITSNELEKIEQKIRHCKPDIEIAYSTHSPVYVVLSHERINLDKIKGQKVFCFCGIGNPDAFFNTIKSLGCEMAGTKIFDDHYIYVQSDLVEMCQQAQAAKAELLLTTRKDYTKVAQFTGICEKIPLGYLEIEITFQQGKNKLTGLIEKTIAGKI